MKNNFIFYHRKKIADLFACTPLFSSQQLKDTILLLGELLEGNVWINKIKTSIFLLLFIIPMSKSAKTRFGRGFIIPLCHLSAKFSLPPDKAWMGAQDLLTNFEIPKRFEGTEIGEQAKMLRQKIMWHQAGGPFDADMHAAVVKILEELLIALDREFGISNPDIGKYHP